MPAPALKHASPQPDPSDTEHARMTAPETGEIPPPPTADPPPVPTVEPSPVPTEAPSSDPPPELSQTESDPAQGNAAPAGSFWSQPSSYLWRPWSATQEAPAQQAQTPAPAPADDAAAGESPPPSKRVPSADASEAPGRRDAAENTTKGRAGATAPKSPVSGLQGTGTTTRENAAPSLVLPTFEDIFLRPPRVWAPRTGAWNRTVDVVSSYLFPRAHGDRTRDAYAPPKKALASVSIPHLHAEQEQAMPRTYKVLGDTKHGKYNGYRPLRKAVVIGVHGWYSQSIFKRVIGAPTGTSTRFATMMAESILRKFRENGYDLDPSVLTLIAPQHDGCVSDRAAMFFDELKSNSQWAEDLRMADAIFVAAHSQGSIVSSLLLSRLVQAGMIDTARTQVCVLSMCGIYQGPFVHLRSTLTTSYINYFETAAARELFEFQSADTQLSAQHRAAYEELLAAGVKYVHTGSIDDNVVPLYSALNLAAAHPSVLRAVYIDGVAFPRTDFLVNLIKLCVSVRNCGFYDHNLLSLLSASVAGSLYGGLGHSLIYDEGAVYDMATRFLFETATPRSSGATAVPLMAVPFSTQRWNPYELPWSLRGLLEDKTILRYFGEDIANVVQEYAAWRPTGKALRDVQWRLSPIRAVEVPEDESACRGGAAEPSGAMPADRRRHVDGRPGAAQDPIAIVCGGPNLKPLCPPVAGGGPKEAAFSAPFESGRRLSAPTASALAAKDADSAAAPPDGGAPRAAARHSGASETGGDWDPPRAGPDANNPSYVWTTWTHTGPTEPSPGPDAATARGTQDVQAARERVPTHGSEQMCALRCTQPEQGSSVRLQAQSGAQESPVMTFDRNRAPEGQRAHLYPDVMSALYTHLRAHPDETKHMEDGGGSSADAPFVTQTSTPTNQTRQARLADDESLLTAHFSGCDWGAGGGGTHAGESTSVPLRRTSEDRACGSGKKARRDSPHDATEMLEEEGARAAPSTHSTPGPRETAHAAQHAPCMAFPSQGPPQVPIAGLVTEPDTPSPSLAGDGAEDPMKLFSASAAASRLPISSATVRDELLQYAHHLYAMSATQGSGPAAASMPNARDGHAQRAAQARSPRQAERDARRQAVTLHPTLLPLLHALHRQHPEHLPTLLLLSCAYFASGNIGTSLWYNNHILRVDANYVEAMSNVGTALHALGYWHEAATWWWRAMQLLPGYWDAFENLLGILCTARVPDEGAPRAPQYATALRLCEYVETHVVPARGTIFASASGRDPRGRVLRGFSVGCLETQALPQHVAITQLPRVQNMFYAKGNLKQALGGHSADAVAEEYQRAVEMMVACPGYAGFSVRDVVVAICVVGILSFGAAVPGTNALSTQSEVAAAFGIDVRNPAYAAVVAQGQYTRVHPEGILGLVRDAGDAAVERLLRVGGGQLPFVLLLPEHVALLSRILFAYVGGTLPVFCAHLHRAPGAGAAVERTYRQTCQVGAAILLALLKVFQDVVASVDLGQPRPSLRGVPASLSVLLPIYYLSLTLSASASAFNNLGIFLSSFTVATSTVGMHGERVHLTGQLLAVRYYAQGLQIDPTHSHLFTNLGSLLKDMGHLAEAVKMYENAVQLNPTFDVALANLGNSVKDQGRTQDAIQYYRRSLQANPEFPEAICGFVNALLAVCEWDEVYPGEGEWTGPGGSSAHTPPAPAGGASQSQETGPRPRSNRGWMQDVTAIVNQQLSTGARYGRSVFKSQGTLVQWLDWITTCLGDNSAETRSRWATRLEPFYRPVPAHVTWNEGGFLLRIIELLLRCTQRRWYWDLYKRGCPAGGRAQRAGGAAHSDAARGATAEQRYPRLSVPACLPQPGVPTVLPFHTFTYPMTPRQSRLISHRNALRTSHAALQQKWLPAHVLPPPRPPNATLNIGYVSSDFNNHPLAHLMQSVFGFHDLSRFSVFLYGTSASDGTAYRAKIEHEAQHFVDVSSWSSESIVQRIQADQIHVLVNLSGYTKGARNDIFAARPCPVQMQFMGFAGAMASGWIDWLVVDETVCPTAMSGRTKWRAHPHEHRSRPTDLAADLDPEDRAEDWAYTERLIYMPHSYFVNDHAQGFRDAGDDDAGLPPGARWAREEARRWFMRRALFPHLPDDFVIFADFNQLYKTEPQVFRAWLRILEQVPKSILWLLRFPAAAEANLLGTARAWAGPDVAARIVFTDVAPKHIHIYRGRAVDLFLDTNECNAHTTAADILWSGTPMLTWPKHLHKMCSRVGASMVRATGLGDRLVVHSQEEYVQRAVQLASSLRGERVHVAEAPQGAGGPRRASPAADGARSAHLAGDTTHRTGDGAPHPPATPGDTAAQPCAPQHILFSTNCTDEAVLRSMHVPPTNFTYRHCIGELMDLRKHLYFERDKCPLFNARAWTRALEAGYQEAWRRWEHGTDTEDSREWHALPPNAPEKCSAHVWLDPYDGTQ
ncbi:hypothetical protein MSPP1_001432 [Malassezia sp. CBS 17886]|nr:hypothetical protein MSPP1_001432 [Malassezia sp. CBS 17886]